MTRAILYIGSLANLSSIFLHFFVSLPTPAKRMPALSRSLRAAAATALLYVPPAIFCQASFFAFFQGPGDLRRKARNADGERAYEIIISVKEHAPYGAPRTRASPRRSSIPDTPGTMMHSCEGNPRKPGSPACFRPPPPREVMRYIWLAPFRCQAPFSNFFHPSIPPAILPSSVHTSTHHEAPR